MLNKYDDKSNIDGLSALHVSIDSFGSKEHFKHTGQFGQNTQQISGFTQLFEEERKSENFLLN